MLFRIIMKLIDVQQNENSIVLDQLENITMTPRAPVATYAFEASA